MVLIVVVIKLLKGKEIGIHKYRLGCKLVIPFSAELILFIRTSSKICS